MYFSTIVYLVIIMFACLFLNLHQMFEEYDYSACSSYDPLYPCKGDWIHKLSVANYGLKFDMRTVVGVADEVTNSLFIVLMYVLLAVFKNRLNNENKIIDIESDTAADFSIMVTYLPKTAKREDIETFFEKKLKVEVSQVSMAFDVGKLLKLEVDKEHLYGRLVNLVENSY